MISRTSAVTLAILAMSGAGCVAGDVETVMSEAEYKAALPDAEQVRIDLPAASARAAAGAVGEPSDLRAMSYAIGSGANQTVNNVLTMLDHITDYPSVGVDENTRRWGPWTEAGSPVTQVFVMQLQEDGDLGYALRWKPAGSDDELTTIIRGLIYGGYGIYKNVGAFEIDYDAAAALNPNVGAQGQARFEYDTASADRRIQSYLDQVLETRGTPIDAQLAFVSWADEGGELGFHFQTDFVEDDGVLEDAALHTRWHYDGAGRSDATITEGSLGDSVVNVSECWGIDTLLDYRELHLDGDLVGAEGDAAACTYEQGEWPAP